VYSEASAGVNARAMRSGTPRGGSPTLLAIHFVAIVCMKIL
jgi:hypothetical protein